MENYQSLFQLDQMIIRSWWLGDIKSQTGWRGVPTFSRGRRDIIFRKGRGDVTWRGEGVVFLNMDMVYTCTQVPYCVYTPYLLVSVGVFETAPSSTLFRPSPSFDSITEVDGEDCPCRVCSEKIPEYKRYTCTDDIGTCISF